MAYVFLLLMLTCIVGLVRPFASLKRKHFAGGAVASFFMIGVTAPPSDQGKAEASTKPTLSAAQMQDLERINAAEIAKLERQAARLPVKDLEANRLAYTRLLELAPGNPKFKAKLAGFEQKIAASARYEDHPEEALSLGKVSWSTGGFGSVMMIDRLTITNEANFDIKDFTLECRHYAPSGTEIDSNRRTLFEIVPANGTKIIREFNMGSISSQAESTSCEITRAKVADLAAGES